MDGKFDAVDGDPTVAEIGMPQLAAPRHVLDAGDEQGIEMLQISLAEKVR